MIRDVVYMLREGGPGDYEELRYSLRSLRNLPHGRVWIFGGRPPWVQGVTHVEVQQGKIKHTNTGFVMGAIGRNTERLSDEFYLFHDDYFIMEPIPEVGRMFRSTWAEWLPSQSPTRAQRTQRLLKEFGKPSRLCYELHVPMIIEGAAYRDMIDSLESIKDGGVNLLCQVQKRSLYGNWVNYGGERFVDPKIRIRDRDKISFPGPYLSTSDTAFSTYQVGVHLRSRFSDPSPYEDLGFELPAGRQSARRWYPHRAGHAR